MSSKTTLTMQYKNNESFYNYKYNDDNSDMEQDYNKNKHSNNLQERKNFISNIKHYDKKQNHNSENIRVKDNSQIDIDNNNKDSHQNKKITQEKMSKNYIKLIDNLTTIATANSKATKLNDIFISSITGYNFKINEFWEGEKIEHLEYMLNYKVYDEPNPNCKQGYKCFNIHNQSYHRRRPLLLQPGKWNYIAIPCKYNPAMCPHGRHCNYSHGKDEFIYHPLIFKTQICDGNLNQNGVCMKYGQHCAKAHGTIDIRKSKSTHYLLTYNKQEANNNYIDLEQYNYNQINEENAYQYNKNFTNIINKNNDKIVGNTKIYNVEDNNESNYEKNDNSPTLDQNQIQKQMKWGPSLGISEMYQKLYNNIFCDNNNNNNNTISPFISTEKVEKLISYLNIIKNQNTSIDTKEILNEQQSYIINMYNEELTENDKLREQNEKMNKLLLQYRTKM